MQETTKQQLEGNWDQMKGRVKETWGEITDDDLTRIEGQVDRLVGLIKERTGESTEAVERKLRELSNRG